MATAYKKLGSSITPGTTWTTLYNVTSGSAVVSSIIAANTTSSAKTFRIGIVSSDTTPTTANCIAYDVSIPANDSVMLTLGISLAAGFYIKAYASTTDVTFNAFGVEIT